MDLRHVRHFVAACEEGSLSAAAQRLHCTASGVSQQISALEALVDVALLERTRRGVVPTPAGWRLYDRCLTVLRAISDAQTELAEFSAGISGSVAAGFAPGLAKAVLPPALARFTEDYPRIDIEIGSGTADSLVAETFGGALDFYVGQFVKPQVGLAATPIGRYPVALISGARRGFSSMEPIRLGDVDPLKLSIPSATHSLRPRIEEAIRHGEIRAERTIAISSLSAGLEFVAQTEWSSILPFWIGLKELENRNVTVNPIVEPALGVELALIHLAHRPLSRPARQLYDYFIQELEALTARWKALREDGAHG